MGIQPASLGIREIHRNDATPFLVVSQNEFTEKSDNIVTGVVLGDSSLCTATTAAYIVAIT